jgi:hypothetical protein
MENKMEGSVMKKQEKIYDKISSLLAKANDTGATVEESQGAMLMAQKIALKYDIDLDNVVENAENGIKDAVFKKETYKKPVTDFINIPLWKNFLCIVISKNFKCYAYIEAWRGALDSSNCGKKRIIFFGLKQDTEIASKVFDYAVDCIERFSNNYMEERKDVIGKRKKTVKDNYINGYIDGLELKFKGQVSELQLALVKDEIVEYEYNEMKIGKGKNVSINIVDAAAYYTGVEKGKEFGSERAILK